MTGRNTPSNEFQYADEDFDEYEIDLEYAHEIYDDDNVRDVNEDIEENIEDEVEEIELEEDSEEIAETPAIMPEAVEIQQEAVMKEEKNDTETSGIKENEIDATVGDAAALEVAPVETEAVEVISDETAAVEVVEAATNDLPEHEMASDLDGNANSEQSQDSNNDMASLWIKGFSHFTIAKHLGLSTKDVRDQIEALNLTDKQNRLPLEETHPYWTANLADKREIERQMLGVSNPNKTDASKLKKEKSAQGITDPAEMISLWSKGYSQFTIAKHIGASTKQVRDEIEKLGLSEKQGSLPLHDDPVYQTADLASKREMERVLLSGTST